MTENFSQQIPRVILRDEESGKWLEFTSPCRVITTYQIDEVLPLIQQIEEAVSLEGVYAAGFISYEAAPAFDASLSVRDDGEYPLLWFGLFEKIEEIILPPFDEKPDTSLSWQSSVTREEYNYCLGQIRRFIAAGDSYQVNFTYRLRAKTGIDPWNLFLRIAGDGEAPFAAFIDTKEWAVCSASPELFLKIDGGRIESRPMKGTAARGLWFEDDLARRTNLRASTKEQAENVMIVDMVRSDIGRIALCGSVHVPALFEIEKYPSVWQMTSTVCAQVNESLERILQATFPPASITGAPKRRTMEIIAELESSPRRIYCGTIGFMLPGNRAQFNVAIRTVLLDKAKGEAEYGVGGGIVWDSQPESEYEECLAKAKVLNSFRKEFDLLETMLWSPVDGCLLWGYHRQRLVHSAEYFAFRVDIDQVWKELMRTIKGLSSRPHKLRLLVSRRGNLSCTATPLDSTAMNFGDVALAVNPIDAGNVFLYHKTTCRGVYENALRLRQEGVSDVLLFNEKGEITESTVANVAVEIDGVLYTPPVQCGLLPGTKRARLLDQGKLQERIISIAEILAGSRVFLLNSVRGMHEVKVHR